MNKPLSEYPRMIMQRDSYLSLNGEWEYTITKSNKIPTIFSGTIIVPFSPEAPLSGVNKKVELDDYLIYRKIFTLPTDFKKDKVIIHFGAVDQICEVYLNNHKVAQNDSGYLPFSAEIGGFLQEKNELVVIVQDFSDTKYYSRGKQKIKRGQIWYTPQTGIFLPVWMESVPLDFISGLKITPFFDQSYVEIFVESASNIEITIAFEKRKIQAMSNTKFKVDVPDFIAWSPNTPHLYHFDVSLGNDKVSSYFAMRKISVDVDPQGIKRLFLNNEPLFQSGLLDQGYYHDGYLTPSSDDALIKDILLAKDMGFNVLRKHIKIEWERFYYHCDRLGMLVWQDFVNGGESYKLTTVTLPAFLNYKLNDHNYKAFGRSALEGRNQFYEEAKRTINHLYNYPCIVLWTVFNEGWGQFDAREMLPFVQGLDNTRLIDITSGWHDQQNGDLKSLHVYFRPYKYQEDKLGRTVILSEFGGYSFKVFGHTFTSKNFGYKQCKNKKDLEKALQKLYTSEIIPAKEKGLAAAIYTQLSDVEDELNGLITYDRQIVKIDKAVMKELNDLLIKQ